MKQSPIAGMLSKTTGTMNTCNSCDARPMAEGEEKPDRRGYCVSCLRDDNEMSMPILSDDWS